MDKARQSLDNKRPGQAPPSQVEAMNGLEQVMQVFAMQPNRNPQTGAKLPEDIRKRLKSHRKMTLRRQPNLEKSC